MARLGKFTKTIYDDDYDFAQCPECCVVISDEQAKDEEFVNSHHLKDLMDCIRCFGCPAVQKAEYKEG